MLKQFPTNRFVILVAIALYLSGCASIQDRLKTRERKPKEDVKQVQVEPVVPLDDKARVPITPLSEAHTQQAVAAQAEYTKALKAMRQNKDQEALVQFQSIAERYPLLAGPWINQGVIQLRSQNYELAATALQNAISRYPNHAYAHNLLGIALREQGQFKSAKASYMKALSIDKNYAKAHYNLAVLADLYLQDLPLALEHFRIYQSLQDNPDETVAGWIKDLTRRTQSALTREVTFS